MKSILIAILFCLLTLNVTSQVVTTSIRYDGNGNVIGGSHFKNKHGKSIKLIDSTTKNYYVLDSKHILITAHNKAGKVLWKTDPYKDNYIQEYRTKRPVIVSFSLVNRPKLAG